MQKLLAKKKQRRVTRGGLFVSDPLGIPVVYQPGRTVLARPLMKKGRILGTTVDGERLKPSRRKPRQIEAQYQRAVFQWAKYLEREIQEIKWLHAIPNGLHLSGLQAKLAKAGGVKAGVFDIFWPWPRKKKPTPGQVHYVDDVLNPPIGPRYYHGLYIEMKGPDGTLTVEQKEFYVFAKREGYCMEVAHDPQEAMRIIMAYAAGQL